jgi:hypothetical protein
MDRKMVSEDELVKILNEEFSKYPDYSQCRFTSISYKLAEPDKNGCNWSKANVSCSGVSGQSCSQIAARIITEAQKKYNIK